MKIPREKIYLISIVLSLIAGFVSLFTVLDKEAGLAPLITIYFSGIAGGAAVSSFLTNKKRDKGKKKTELS